VRFRIDGVLHKVYELPHAGDGAVVSRIKMLGRMDLAEKRRPQDGRIKTRSPGGREVEMRLSTMPTAFGEKLVMRIFDPDVAGQAASSELGFKPRRGASGRMSSARTASCWSPAPPARARPPRCIPR
jgi:general secretion pathway protein E